MRIRTKLLILLFCSLFLFAGVLILQKRFSEKRIILLLENEKRDKRQVFDRFLVLKGQLMETLANDYTYWDDMVNFIDVNPDKAWAEQNLDVCLSTYKINVVWTYKTDLSLVYSVNNLEDKGADLKEFPLPKETIVRLFEKGRLCHFFLNTHYGVMEVRGATVHPTNDPERKTPPKGYFLSGRFLNDEYLSGLSILMGGKVTIELVGKESIPLEGNPAKKGIITFSEPLYGWDGNILGRLDVGSVSTYFADFRRLFTLDLIWTAVFYFLAAIFFFLVFMLWTYLPLSLISQTLVSEDSKYISRLQKNRDEFGDLARLIASFFRQKNSLVKEIDERMKAQEELRKSEERFRDVAGSTGEWIWEVDSEGRYTYSSPGVEKVLGHKPEEVLGKYFYDFFIPEDRDRVKKEASEVFARKEPFRNFINWNVHKDGRMVFIETSGVPIVNAEGNLTGYRGVDRDITERKKMEDALKLEKDKAQTYLDVAGAMLLVIDTSGVVNLINKKGCEVLGYSEEEVVGKNWFDHFLPAANREEIKNVFVNLMSGDIKLAEYHENLIVDKDGDERLIAWHNVVLRDKNNKAIGTLSSGEEITVRKEAELALRESRQRLEDIINFSPDATFVVDMTGKIIAWNEAIETMTGVKAEDMLGKGDYEYSLPFYGNRRPILVDLAINPGLYSELEKSYAYFCKEKDILVAELFLPRLKEGGIFVWAKATPLYDQKGKAIGAIETIRDITDRKRYEEKLAKINDCFLKFGTDPFKNIRNLVDLCGEIMGGSSVLYNRIDGGFLCTRAQWHLPPDYPLADKPEGHICYDVIKQGLDQPLTVRNMPQTSYAQTDPNVAKYQLQTYMGMAVKCGPECIGTICVVYQKDFIPSEDDKKFLSIIASAVGVEEARGNSGEELKIAYEQLQKTQSQLIQSAKMASVGLLAGGIAHEINNPLTGILNNLQLIRMIMASKDKDFTVGEFKEFLAAMEESAQRCKKITQSLLGFSHASKGLFKSLSLNDIVEKVVALVGHELTLQNITIQTNLQPGLPLVSADSQLMQQAIFDLISNANWAIRKKSDSGYGTVTIESRYQPEDKTVCILISDTGIGMAQEIQQRLFEPFFTTKQVGEGTGLGLSIVYNIIKSHEGTITVESKVDQGTTFKIVLPVAAQEKG
jgi:two-component system, NtrC family, sensor kinase